jgi:hypothetical protein
MNIRKVTIALLVCLCAIGSTVYVRGYVAKRQEAKKRAELFASLQLSEAQKNYLSQYTMPKTGGGWNAALLSTRRIDSDILDGLFPYYTFLALHSYFDDGLHPFFKFLRSLPLGYIFTRARSRPGGYFVNIIALDYPAKYTYTARFYASRCCFPIEQFSSLFHDARISLLTESDVMGMWEAFVNLLYPDKVFTPNEVEIFHPEESVWIIRELSLCECEYRVELTEEKTVASFKINNQDYGKNAKD